MGRHHFKITWAKIIWIFIGVLVVLTVLVAIWASSRLDYNLEPTKPLS
jgi:hypothetical protein